MTLTETRPETVADEDVAPAAPALGSWITTGDHKRLGLLFVYGGALSVIAGCLAAALFQLPSLGDSVNAWTQTGSRLASIATTTTFVIGIPALWIGLATYVMPLQIGATRLALPRLHHLALWLFAAGGVLVTIGYLADRSLLNGLGASAPAQLSGKANDATELLIAGLAIVAIATFLAALDLVVTVLTRRAAGLRVTLLPTFSWSVLGTASVLVLATPGFLAGLVLLYYDRHYGGSLLSSAGGIKIWAHELWLLGRPEALVFAAAGVGLFSDVVVTHTRRPLMGHGIAAGAAAAAAPLTLLLWMGRSTTVTASPFAPIATVPAVLVGLPVLLGLLSWLRT
ncbi:MAG TPA: cbb3-type cytochrome c oxidase subunit I, partial [Acidimicrobiales bacterium]|nr:cbb3-type cytochrome c oxidase subunit I [Acidimicrobiales bacterium]